jgi:hypothetical protein
MATILTYKITIPQKKITALCLGILGVYVHMTTTCKFVIFWFYRGEREREREVKNHTGP